MRRRWSLIALAVMFYLLQLALLVFAAIIGGSHGAPYDVVLVVCLAAVIGGIVFALTRYLLATLDRSEQAYVATLERDVDDSLASYLSTVRAQEAESATIARAIAAELAQARRALEASQPNDLDTHLLQGMSLASQAAQPKSSNPTIAAVLDSKARQCLEAGVTLDAKAALPASLPIPDVELASIFFNLIDNALHECETLAALGVPDSLDALDAAETRDLIITVRSSVQAGQLFIKVSNPCREKRPLASPRERRVLTAGRHGWGLEIVGTAAKRYGGISEFRREDASFVAEVMIPIGSSQNRGTVIGRHKKRGRRSDPAVVRLS